MTDGVGMAADTTSLYCRVAARRHTSGTVLPSEAIIADDELAVTRPAILANVLPAQGVGWCLRPYGVSIGMFRVTVPRRSSQVFPGERTMRSTTSPQEGQRATSAGGRP